jgi:carboxymethylenebutenolidase
MPMIDLVAADGHRLQAYRAGPADAPRALVLIQEIFGVNGHIQRLCEDFGAHGYAVIAPCLYDRIEPGIELGYTAEDVARGRALKGQVDEHKTLLDALAAAAALPAGAKRGIIGYCWGGTVAWHGAVRSSAFAAACGWYGGGIAAARTEAPRCPVQLHFGEVDSGIPIADVDAIKAAQPEVEVFVYAGAGHGFGCEERNSYSAPDALVARERTLQFFRKHLG